MASYIVVTGAAGFIGSNLVRALNDRGVTNIIAVDNLTRADKFRNLVDCDIAEFMDKTDFLERMQRGDRDATSGSGSGNGGCWWRRHCRC